jgi:hypothetical protein
MRRWAGVLVLALCVGAIVGVFVRPPDRSDQAAHSGGRIASNTDMEMMGVPPPDLYTLVRGARAIVVARHYDIQNHGTRVVFTPDPTPEGAATLGIPVEPTRVWDTTATRYIVDQIIKGDGNIAVNDVITVVTDDQHVPANATELAQDAASFIPVSWPTNTEFVLLLGVDPDEGLYYCWWDRFGRILTSGQQVTASDAARTVPSFFEGMDRNELISAIETAVALPTPTSTVAPETTATATQTPSPTATPCYVPGC